MFSDWIKTNTNWGKDFSFTFNRSYSSCNQTSFFQNPDGNGARAWGARQSTLGIAILVRRRSSGQDSHRSSRGFTRRNVLGPAEGQRMLRTDAQISGTAERRQIDEDREQDRRRADVVLLVAGADLCVDRKDDYVLPDTRFDGEF